MAGKRGGLRNPPGGRPKGSKNKLTVEMRMTLAETARQYTKECLEVLRKIARDPKVSASARCQAVNALLDRGYGKPTQPLEHSGTIGTHEDALERLAAEDAAEVAREAEIASAASAAKPGSVH